MYGQPGEDWVQAAEDGMAVTRGSCHRLGRAVCTPQEGQEWGLGVGLDPRIDTVRTETWERIWVTLRIFQMPPRIIEGKMGGKACQDS